MQKSQRAYKEAVYKATSGEMQMQFVNEFYVHHQVQHGSSLIWFMAYTAILLHKII